VRDVATGKRVRERDKQESGEPVLWGFRASTRWRARGSSNPHRKSAAHAPGPTATGTVQPTKNRYAKQVSKAEQDRQRLAKTHFGRQHLLADRVLLQNGADFVIRHLSSCHHCTCSALPAAPYRERRAVNDTCDQSSFHKRLIAEPFSAAFVFKTHQTRKALGSGRGRGSGSGSASRGRGRRSGGAGKVSTSHSASGGQRAAEVVQRGVAAAQSDRAQSKRHRAAHRHE
jgi:hypothetical protein